MKGSLGNPNWFFCGIAPKNLLCHLLFYRVQTSTQPPFLIFLSPVPHYRAFSIDPDTPDSSPSIITSARPSCLPKVRPSSFPLLATQAKTFISHLNPHSFFLPYALLLSLCYCLGTLWCVFCVLHCEETSERGQSQLRERERERKR